MTRFARTTAAVLALLCWAGAARADYFIRDGNGTQQTVKAFSCASAICPGYAPMDLTGAPFGVLSNPFYVAPVQDVRPVAGTISIVDTGSTTSTGQNGVTIVTGTPTANSAFAQAINGQGTARAQLSGTWTGTVTFEGSIDNGATWVAQPARVTGTGYTGSSATAKGMFLIDASGLTNIRARATAAVTGAVTILFTFANNDGLIQVANPIRLFDNASGYSAAINSSGALAINCLSGCTGGGGSSAITAAAGSYSAGALSSGTGVDGWDLTQGSTTDAAATAGSTGTLSAKLRLMTSQLATLNTTLGSPAQAGGSVTANAGTNLNTSLLALESGGNLASLVTQIGAVTASPTANTIADRLKTINTTLGSPMQAGGTISTAPTTSGGLSVYLVQPIASDNHANIKNGAGQVYKVDAFNNSGTVNYIRLYNAGTGFNGCNSATNLVWQGIIPGSTSGSGLSSSWDLGMAFATGISICVTSGYATTDTTSATASALIVNVGYK